MKDWLLVLIDEAAVLVEAVAFVVIVGGTIEAAVATARSVFEPAPARSRRLAGLRFARWLVAGLTFQIAAGVLELAVAATWDSVERLACLALIRAFLTPFQALHPADLLARIRLRLGLPAALAPSELEAEDTG